jgi:uncharacterized protein (DUF362 family)
MQERSVVSIVNVESSVQDAVRRAMTLAGFERCLERDRPTCLKINLGWDLFIPGSITSPWVIEGVIQTVKNWVGPLYLVESDQVLESIELAFSKCRLQELCDRYGVRWMNMSHTEQTLMEVPNGKIFKSIQLPKILTETQLITIPVMKTHAKTQITGAIKNQWGCISKMRHNYHLVLSDALADINSVVRPAFAVLDATIGLEGNGPKSGHPRIVDKILASSDIVAIDTIQAKLMGLEESKIQHIQVCAQRCLGTSDPQQIEIVGDRDSLQRTLGFVPAKHNIVSRIEEICRRSWLRRIVFDTPLFRVMLVGAKLWYLIWYHFVKGKKIWREILKHPRYGLEWQNVQR